MRILTLLERRRVRIPGLIVLLAITVLAALWQQTSASSNEIAPIPATIARKTTPAPTATPSDMPQRTTTTPKTARNPQVIADPASLTAVVNKQRALPTSYIPAGLVVPDIATRYGARAMQSQLRPEAARAMEQLFAAAHSDGIELVLVSGYRSAAYQATVYNSAVRSAGQAAADIGVARPGHSEHQTGLGADLGNASATCEIAACFGDTPEGRWLTQHGHEYGFIVRYPSGKQSLTGYQYEPWHVRYVGTAVAGNMTASNQTLEEYFGFSAATQY